MGLDLSFHVLAVDSQGELVLESVKGPHFAFTDSLVYELFDEAESARLFGPVAAGLSLDWYRRTTIGACHAENRYPRTADCFRPDDIRRDVETILLRLGEFDDRLPRRYSYRKHPAGQSSRSAEIFLDDRVFHLGAGWDFCAATWQPERRDDADRWATSTSEERVERMLAMIHAPFEGVRHDLRATPVFPCREALYEADTWRPGDAIEVHVTHCSAREHFEPYLTSILSFCAEAESGKFLVYTGWT